LLAVWLKPGTSLPPSGAASSLTGQAAPALGQEGLVPYATPDTLPEGELRLVNFWASWCPPCRAEHPTLLELAGSDLQIVGVNMQEDPVDARAYLEQAGNPFDAIVADRDGSIAAAWGLSAPPQSFLVDGSSKVLLSFAGPLVGADYEQRFLPALEAAR
jgi:cytochrome c biogenesis protein CcmG/thiol:disulfide interchange protein DsbE